MTFSAFHEVQHGLLYLDFLQESLPLWMKSWHDRSWAAKPFESGVAPLTAGNLN